MQKIEVGLGALKFLKGIEFFYISWIWYLKESSFAQGIVNSVVKKVLMEGIK